MATDLTLRNPVRAYIDLRRGLLSNLQLIELAQDRIASPDAPTWIAELANLRTSDEKRTARQLFERRLVELGLLPDSRHFREQLQLAVFDAIERIVEYESEGIDISPITHVVFELFHMCPGFQSSGVSVPIQEFPCESLRVQTASELVSYIKAHINELIPLGCHDTA